MAIPPKSMQQQMIGRLQRLLEDGPKGQGSPDEGFFKIKNRWSHFDRVKPNEKIELKITSPARYGMVEGESNQKQILKLSQEINRLVAHSPNIEAEIIDAEIAIAQKKMLAAFREMEKSIITQGAPEPTREKDVVGGSHTFEDAKLLT